MRRALGLLILFAVAAAGVDVLGDLTQTRPDRVKAGSRSEIVLQVSERSGRRPARFETAEGLWYACRHVAPTRLAAPGLVDIGGGRFKAVTEPALGEHAWRRLQGCLEDMTIDRVRAEVVSKRDVAPAPSD
ncbi:MAG: hypothetical protein ACRD2W_08625 [Acidimicrobiales bacterium]